MRWWVVISYVVGVLFLSGCAVQDVYTLTLITGERLEIPPDEKLRGDVLLFDGDFVLEEGGLLTGNLFVLGGDAFVASEVQGEVVLLFGSLRLEPSALILGNLNLTGGVFSCADGAEIRGQIESGLSDHSSAQASRRSLSLWFVLMGGFGVSVTSYLFLRYRPLPVRRIQEVFLRHWLVAAAMGVLGFVVIPTLLLLMVFTVVLIPVVLILGLLLVFLLLLGWVAIGLTLGEWISGRLSRQLPPRWLAAMGALLLWVLYFLLERIPPIHFLVFGSLFTVSLGALLLTRFGFTRFTPPEEQSIQEKYQNGF
jgi:hypothetical protein